MITILDQLFDPTTPDATRVSLLGELDACPITPDILSTVVRYIKRTQTFECPIPRAMDIVGTGGSGLQRINTSTIVSLLASREGIPIVKHGNNAASGRVGSFDLLQSLGYSIPLTADEVYHDMETTNLACLYAKVFFPCMGKIAEARRLYGKPTIFNLIGPLLSPANPDVQLIGCAREDMMETVATTAGRLGRKLVWVVRGEDGLDEVTLTGATRVVQYYDGQTISFTIRPEDYGYAPCTFDEIKGGDTEQNTIIARDILGGKGNKYHRNLVELNLQVVRSLWETYTQLKRTTKICGLREPLPSYDGISYIGLNMIRESKRYITPEQTKHIVETLPTSTQAVLITRDMPREEILKLSAYTKVPIIQCHGKETPEFCTFLKNNGLIVWKALPASDWNQAHAYSPSAAMFIFDGVKPGSGQDYDYSILRNCHYPFLVAGGVTRENKDAILSVLPNAVGLDIASGAETCGQKDMLKIGLLVR